MEQFGAGCRLKSTGRCVSAPSERMHPSCEVGPRYMRKGKQMPVDAEKSNHLKKNHQEVDHQKFPNLLDTKKARMGA